MRSAGSSFLDGGGTMGRLMRGHDWSTTGLGAPEIWAHGLRTAVRLMLNTGHPMYVFWGERSICLYNDAYAQSLGPEQHPSSLGRIGSEVWSDIWEQIGPQIDQVLGGGGATWHENQLVPITRNGKRQRSYWTYSFGPIDDEGADNGIGGVLVVCTETTRQMELARNLAVSEERLNQALSAGRGVGTWDWDVQNDLVFADDRFARLYGANPARARAGAPLAEFFTAIHPEDQPGLKRLIDITLKGQEVFSAEYRLVKHDGSICWVVADGQCTFDEGGLPIRLAGVSMDITDRKQAETKLRDSEAHLRSVLSALHEGIFVTDPTGRLISCNPAAERIIGSTWAQWQGGSVIAPGWQPLRDDGSPMPAEELPVGRVLAGAGPQIDVELKALDQDGCPAVFRISAVPVNSEDTGALLAVVTLFVDVTARRRADEELAIYRQGLEVLVARRTADLEVANLALEKAAGFSRALTDAIPGRVVYWNSEYICTFANQAFADWFGTSPDKLIGVYGPVLHGAEYFEFIRPDVEAAFQGKRQHLIRETTDARGQPVTHQVQYVPDFSDDGKVRGICVVGYDVTGLRAAQAELQRTNQALAASRDEAEQANRAKSAFLANMSHEIRTPMNAVIGLTHLMQRGNLDEEQRSRVNDVAAAAKHLLALIDAILDLSKIEAGKLVLETEEFSTAELIESAVAMVSDRAREKGLSLSTKAIGLPRALRGDRLRLSQILINLLSNAVKFTSIGAVELRAKVIDRAGARTCVLFEVQDTGVGVDLQHQAAVFGAFEQGDSSISRNFGGTGLGLALSRELARAMGGDMSLSSELGTGSTFRFTAWFDGFAEDGAASRPKSAAAATSAGSSEELLRRRHSGKRILLAEDNPINRIVAEGLLRSTGLVVDSAGDGAKALEMMEAAPYDVVLMDMQMPVIDGLQASRTLRERGCQLPIIAMTANAYLDDRQACLDAGMDAHVTKPVEPEALYLLLLRYLDGQAGR